MISQQKGKKTRRKKKEINKEERIFTCPVSGCSKNYPHQGTLINHCNRKHSDVELPDKFWLIKNRAFEEDQKKISENDIKDSDEKSHEEDAQKLKHKDIAMTKKKKVSEDESVIIIKKDQPGERLDRERALPKSIEISPNSAKRFIRGKNKMEKKNFSQVLNEFFLEVEKYRDKASEYTKFIEDSINEYANVNICKYEGYPKEEIDLIRNYFQTYKILQIILKQPGTFPDISELVLAWGKNKGYFNSNNKPKRFEPFNRTSNVLVQIFKMEWTQEDNADLLLIVSCKENRKSYKIIKEEFNYYRQQILKKGNYPNLRNIIYETEEITLFVLRRLNKIIYSKKNRSITSTSNKLVSSIILKNNILKHLKIPYYNSEESSIESFYSYIAKSNFDIGNKLMKKCDYINALIYCEKARNIYFKLYGDYDVNTGLTYNYIGLIYQKNCMYDEALKNLEKDLNINLKIYGKNHRSTADSYNNIGSLYHDKYDYVRALPFYEESLKIYINLFGECHQDTAVVYNNIGFLYISNHNEDKGFEYIQKALDIRIKALGESHPDTASSYNEIGLYHSDKRNYEKALEYFQKSLTININVFGELHLETGTSYLNIGEAYRHNKDIQKALNYIEKSSSIFLNLLGKYHTDTTISYENIASIYKDKGEYEKALNYYEKSLDINLELFGENNVDTLMIYMCIAKIYLETHQVELSEEYFKKANNVIQKLLGEQLGNAKLAEIL